VRELLTTVGIGFVSGVLSGMFGIGGGIVTTPAIRLILGAPALVAVGTPLPVIFPSAVTGAINYLRRGSLDVRVGVTCGIAGSLFAVLGALATQYVGGTVVLLATAALILYTAADMLLQVIRPPRVGLEASEERDAFRPPEVEASDLGSHAAEGEHEGAEGPGQGSGEPRVLVPPTPAQAPSPKLATLALIGALTGAYSGFLGLGGGFILVPLLTRWLHFDIKRAIGTSLLAIAIIAVPSTITHAFLGHIDWGIAAALIVGVIPGAWLGARVTLGSSDRTTRIAFAVMLLAVGAWLGAAELGWLPR
jgi:uncharacterized membrane protein YfcA